MVTGALEGPQQISKKPLSLWKTRNYLLLWAGSGVSIVGSRATSVAYPLLVLAVTGSPAMAGWVAFTRLLPDVLFYIPAGPFVDRWHWRRTMLATEVGRGLAVGTIGLALLFGNLGVVHIFIVALVEGTLGVFYRLSEPGRSKIRCA